MLKEMEFVPLQPYEQIFLQLLCYQPGRYDWEFSQFVASKNRISNFLETERETGQAVHFFSLRKFRSQEAYKGLMKDFRKCTGFLSMFFGDLKDLAGNYKISSLIEFFEFSERLLDQIDKGIELVVAQYRKYIYETNPQYYLEQHW